MATYNNTDRLVYGIHELALVSLQQIGGCLVRLPLEKFVRTNLNGLTIILVRPTGVEADGGNTLGEVHHLRVREKFPCKGALAILPQLKVLTTYRSSKPQWRPVRRCASRGGLRTC